MRLRILILAGLAAAVAAPASAHHSYAMFDRNKEVTLVGTVKDFQWTNPHCWIQVIVKDKSGKVVEWSVEAVSPNALAREGWKPKSLKAGDKATVVIHPLRNGSNGGALMTASVNGQQIGRKAEPAGP